MRRVAVFGKAGGGESTLAKGLADLTGLPLHAVDTIQHGPGGEKVPHERYPQIHAELLRRDAWIIDGLGRVASAWERFAAADTPVHVDLPLPALLGHPNRGTASPAGPAPRSRTGCLAGLRPTAAPRPGFKARPPRPCPRRGRGSAAWRRSRPPAAAARGGSPAPRCSLPRG